MNVIINWHCDTIETKTKEPLDSEIRNEIEKHILDKSKDIHVSFFDTKLSSTIKGSGCHKDGNEVVSISINTQSNYDITYKFK